jgi:hypothetical protein
LFGALTLGHQLPWEHHDLWAIQQLKRRRPTIIEAAAVICQN